MKRYLFVFLLTCLMAPYVWAEDHAELVSGDYQNALDVTDDCLSCHIDQGEDVIQTAHWLWSGPTPYMTGHEKDTVHGKRNLMNNF